MDPTLLGAPVPVPTPQRHRKGVSRNVLFMIGGLVVAIIIGLLLIFISGDNSAALRPKLSARSDATLALIADGKKNVKGAELAKLNSELYLVLLTDNVATSKALTTAGLKKVDPKVKTSEAVTSTLDSLKTAKVNGQYDDVYKTALTSQLTKLNSLSKELHTATNSKSLKTALSTQYTHVAEYLKQLQAL